MAQPVNSSCTLSVFGNTWGLLELPRRPSLENWSLSKCLDLLVENGFDGCQGDAGSAKAIHDHRLRFALSGRVNLPSEAADLARSANDTGAECVTVHLGWGMESNDEIDALVDALLNATARWGVPLYPETHRATVFQDIRRTCDAILRRPNLRFNGDFSHFYCGQEMTYQGFHLTREYLRPILNRTRFLHARVSDAQCMQADVLDPANAPHVENFKWLWREVFTSARKDPTVQHIYFTPELGPPSSGYAITYRDASGNRIEASDRWTQTCHLAKLARELFTEVSATDL